MIVIMKPMTEQKEIDKLAESLTAQGVEVNPVYGTDLTILGLVGDTSKIDPSRIEANRNVERVVHVAEPFKKANRMFHPDDTVLDIAGRTVGGKKLMMVAGPCSVESEEQIFTAARQARAAGVCLLRGGAFKPRTSPYDFSGLGAEGLRLLIAAGRETGLPVVSELMSAAQLDAFADVDVIQIGARNMQNFDLLRALGRSEKPVLLKRGVGATLQELLLSAEYLLAAGNPRVMLCERGIRTFDTFTRGTLDLAAVPALHEMTHLPVLVDPSHAAGRAALVTPLALAAAACGADGVMVEMHPDPLHARCDGAQALLPEELAALSQRLHAVREACR